MNSSGIKFAGDAAPGIGATLARISHQAGTNFKN